MNFSEFENGINEASPSEARLKQYVNKYLDLQKKAKAAAAELAMRATLEPNPVSGVPNQKDITNLDEAYEDLTKAFEAFIDHVKTAP